MEPVREHRKAVAISPFDLPEGSRLLVTNCEDCACAVPSSGQTAARVGDAQLMGSEAETFQRSPDLLFVELDKDHVLAFNPRAEGGNLLTMNHVALRALDCFVEPTDLATAWENWKGEHAEFRYLTNRFRESGLIERPDKEPHAHSYTGDVLTVWLHVTNECNLRCPYCYIAKTRDRMSATVADATIARVFRSAQDHGFSGVKLKYAGGEATLNLDRVVEMHNLAKSTAQSLGLSYEASLLTNGVAIPLRFIEFLRNERVKVMVSLDGVGDDHDANRPFLDGRGSFQRVEATVSKLIAHGVLPHISITISNRNVDRMHEVVRYSLDRDLTFSLNLFRDNDCASSFEDLRFSEERVIEGFRRAFLEIERQLPPWSVLGSVLDRGQLLRPRDRSCGVGLDYVVIDQDGGIAKCHMEIERKVGDIFSADPVAAVRGDRQLLNLAASEKEGCRSCVWQNWCSGGCPVATFKATGRFDIRSPNCNIYKAIYPMALRLEGLRLLKYVPQ